MSISFLVSLNCAKGPQTLKSQFSCVEIGDIQSLGLKHITDNVIYVTMYRKILGKEHTGQKIYKCFWLGRLLSSQSREPEKTGGVAQNCASVLIRLDEEKTSRKAAAPCVSPVVPYLKYSHIKSVNINIYIHTKS